MKYEIFICLLLLSCNHREPQSFCELKYSNLEFTNDCKSDTACKIFFRRVNEKAGTVHFFSNGILVEADTLRYTKSDKFLISRDSIQSKNKKENCISISVNILDSMRRFLYVEENGGYWLRLIQTVENDSTIHVSLLMTSSNIPINGIFENKVEFLQHCRKNFARSFFELKYHYYHGNMYYKLIGHYPWEIEPADYSTMHSDSNMPYIDIKKIDSIFVNL